MFENKVKAACKLHMADKSAVKDNILSEISSVPVKIKSGFKLNRIVAACASLCLIIALIGGTAIAVEAAEYNRAVSFLNEKGISTEDKTRNEIKDMYAALKNSPEFSIDISIEIPSDFSSQEPTPPVVSEIIHEEYGKQIQKSRDNALRLFKKTEDENNIFTVCLYNEQAHTYEMLDQLSIDENEELSMKYEFFTDNWNSNENCHFFLNGTENTIGYYVRSTKKTGFLPINDPGVARATYFTNQSQYSRFTNPWSLKDRICWVETNSTHGEEEDKLYIYDPETDTKTLLYQSDGIRWIDRYWVAEEKMYIKTAKITDFSCDMEDFDPTGDLYCYDGEEMTVVAENIREFKLDENGMPYIKRTENGDWEKLNEN